LKVLIYLGFIALQLKLILPSHLNKHLLEKVVFGGVVKTLLMVCLLTLSCAFAQDWYVGVGATISQIPVTVVAGYNTENFGVRLSADVVFAGLDVYGRLPFTEGGSSAYLGAGLGYSLTGAFVNAVVPPGDNSGNVPLVAEGLLGLEFRAENLGFFLEYAPVFPLSGSWGINGLIGAFHFGAGLNIHF
jgi:hypothetical protein